MKKNTENVSPRISNSRKLSNC